jgi:single-strand DNA-binding protein
MGDGINKVILIGNLGKDPELKYTSSGVPFCRLSVATKDSWGTGADRQERTEWHHVVVWRGQAEQAAKYLAKGRQVYVEGRIQSREWTDDAGVKRQAYEIQAERVTFLGGGKQADKQAAQWAADDAGDELPF